MQGDISSTQTFARLILVPVLGLMFLVSLVAWLIAPPVLSRLYMYLCLALAIGAIVFQFIYHASGPRTTNWFSVDIIFMLAFFTVHFVYPLFWAVGLAPSSYEIWINEAVVCRATMMSVCGFLAFALGFNVLADRYSHVQWPVLMDNITLQRWRTLGKVFLVIGVLVAGIYILLLGELLTIGVYQSTPGEYREHVIKMLLVTLMRIAFVLLTVAAAMLTGKWKIGWLSKIAILMLLAWILILGDRSLAFGLAAILVAAYSEYAKRISFKKLVLFIAAGFFLAGVVRVARYSPERTVSSFVKTAQEKSEEITWDTGLMNFAGSVRTVYAAVDIVPQQHDYFYGRLEISGLAGIIPFSRRLLPKKIEYTTSASYLTWVMHAGDFSSGVGTTIIADTYMDFGLIGVVAVMFGVGLLSKHIQQKARATCSLTWAVAHACLIASLALIPRYSMTYLVRDVLWPVLLILLASKILSLGRVPNLPAEMSIEQVTPS